MDPSIREFYYVLSCDTIQTFAVMKLTGTVQPERRSYGHVNSLMVWSRCLLYDISSINLLHHDRIILDQLPDHFRCVQVHPLSVFHSGLNVRGASQSQLTGRF